MTVNLPAGAAADLATNPSAQAAEARVVYDANGPTVTLTSTESSVSNLQGIPVTATFSELVIGFNASSVTTSNARVATASFPPNGTSFVFVVNASGEGALSAQVHVRGRLWVVGRSDQADLGLKPLDCMPRVRRLLWNPSVQITTILPRK